jgi:prepilin-type N-terminal cleavage/methylation domain-containing protein
MFRIIRNRFNNRRGVTLIEVMAVIVILGILSAIAIPSVYGYAEKAKETKFLLEAVNLKAATGAAYESNPALKNKGSGSGRNMDVAAAIAAMLRTTSFEYGTYQLYGITDIDVPTSSKSYIQVTDDGKVYLKGDHVLRTAGEKLSEALGYGKLATPSEIAIDPSLKNENIYWAGHLGVGGHGSKDAGHLLILLYSF